LNQELIRKNHQPRTLNLEPLNGFSQNPAASVLPQALPSCRDFFPRPCPPAGTSEAAGFEKSKMGRLIEYGAC